ARARMTSRCTSRACGRPRTAKRPAARVADWHGFEAPSGRGRSETGAARPRQKGLRSAPVVADSVPSERDVVVDALEVLSRSGRAAGASAAAGFPAAAATRAAGSAAVAAATTATATTALAAFTAAEQLHLVGDNLGRPAILAFLVLPLAGLKVALDVAGAAFLEVLAGDLGESVEEHHPVPFGFLATLAGLLVLPVARGGEGDVADCRAIGRVADLGVATEVPDQDHLVDRCHIASVEFSSACRGPCHWRRAAALRPAAV